jgi:hypothetical protein
VEIIALATVLACWNYVEIFHSCDIYIPRRFSGSVIIMDTQYNLRLRAAEKTSAREHPGQTVVLDAKTLAILIASKDSSKIAEKLRSISDDIVPLFIAPAGREVALHHFCLSQDDL